MTDEEKLAEEYVKSVIDVNAFDWKIVREIYLAFLEGLKAGSQLDKVWHDYDAGEDCYEDTHEGSWIKREAGRPEWHDLRKNPNDLPKVMGEYPCVTDEGKEFCECYKIIDDKKPKWGTFNEVFAWYDLPKFERK